MIRLHGHMRPQRTRDHAYRRRDTRPSGKHPTDWILVAALVGLALVGIAGWLR